MAITIVDYGVGNLGSIRNILRKVGAEVSIAKTVQEIEQASKIILPGVGAFDSGIKHIHESGLLEVLNEKALNEKVPFLGICLGMQLLTQGSEEGELAGLGWIPTKIRKFDFSGLDSRLRIPHMGWNTVKPIEHPLMEGLNEESRFYFVHSFHAPVEPQNTVLARTHYGFDFACAIHHENIMGVQFHPEKSHKFGMKLFKNFVEHF